MIRSVSRAISKPQLIRSFALLKPSEGKGKVVSEQDQSAGRRLEELQELNAGREAFNRDPIVPDSKAGTKENPILVPSGAHSRAVGFEDPNSHQLQWFNLTAGSIHFIPTIGLYFKLQEI